MKIVVIAGPNGAGKSTVAPRLLRETLGVDEFVNADAIASGLSAFRPEAAAFTAGRVMLTRLRELAAQRLDFAFETTLASRSFAPWIRRLKGDGYSFHLMFLYLASPEIAVSRVAGRVKMGGHDVPEETVRRRYERGLRNLFRLYLPLADGWWIYDLGSMTERLIAYRPPEAAEMAGDNVLDEKLWNRIQETYS